MNHPSIVAISAREREAESGSLYSNSVQSEHQPTPEPADYQRACSELQKMAQDMQELSAAYQRLLDLTRAVTELREPEEMFRRTLDAAVNVTGAERGFLFLLPEGAERSPASLTVAACYQIRLEEITQGHFKFSRSAISQVLSQGFSVRVGGDSDASQSMQEFGWRAILCEPLKVQDEILGILYLDTSRKESFSDFHAELLQSFGSQAAVCLANVRLLEQREIALKRQHAQEVQRQSLSAFLSVASRELRGPVTALRTGMSLLQKNRLGSELKAMVVDDLDRSVKRTERMLHSYDALQELQAGRVTSLYCHEFSIGELLEERVKAAFELLGQDERARFDVRVEANEGDLLTADRVKLSEILDCLLTNAIAQSSAGGLLRVQYEPSKDFARIMIEDEGAPLEPAQIVAIEQGQPRMNGGRSNRGEQLALFLASNLVRVHHGHLEVTSGPTNRFTVWLPTSLSVTSRPERAHQAPT